MIWSAVFPTLTVLNLSIGPWFPDGGPVLRTFVLATIAVPIVIYGIMPRLHRIRMRLLSRRAALRRQVATGPPRTAHWHHTPPAGCWSLASSIR